jgi:hypothetical protein
MEHPWPSYLFISIVVAFAVSIFTENSVLRRITHSDGVVLIGGKCRLKPGYGPSKDSDDIRVQLDSVKQQLDSIMSKLDTNKS